MSDTPNNAVLEPQVGRPSTDVISHVKEQHKQLSKSEKKIAQLLMGSPEQFINASVKEVASIADVSEATVVRFGRSIGCDGFKDLKILLAQHLAVEQALKDSGNGCPPPKMQVPILIRSACLL